MNKTCDPSLIAPEVVAREVTARRVRQLAAALMADGSDLGECADDLARALKAANLTLERGLTP